MCTLDQYFFYVQIGVDFQFTQAEIVVTEGQDSVVPVCIEVTSGPLSISVMVHLKSASGQQADISKQWL